MERQLIDYLPDVVRGFDVFQGIATGEQPEFELAWASADDLLENQFLATAGILGLSRWEQIFHITPKGTDTLEIRRARIRAMLGIQLPYTITWLRNLVNDIYGPAGHLETVTDYTLDLQFDYTVIPNGQRLAEEILEMLIPVCPVNLRLALGGLVESNGSISYALFSETSIELEVWPIT